MGVAFADLLHLGYLGAPTQPMAETMEQTEQQRARKNVFYAFGAVIAVVALALFPAYCREKVEPQSNYADLAAARRSPGSGEWLPGFLPASARRIYERHGRYRRFVRFEIDSADVGPMAATLVRLDTAAARRVPVPVAGWSAWWQLAPQTLQSGQGKQVWVYRVEQPVRDRGYLVFDPRTSVGYYWSTAE